MSTLSLLFLSGCIVLLFAVQGSSAVKCYVCTALSGCDDEFNKNAAGVLTVDCDAASCFKTKKDDKVLIRGCVPSVYGMSVDEDGCKELDGAHACICNSDLCNGSTTVTASISILAALAFVVAIINRW